MNTQNTVESVGQNIGLLMMATAATLGLLDFPDHPKAKVVLAAQPVYAYAQTTAGVNPLRREREESAPHYISYSAVQRTPGRTGRI